MNAEKQFEEAKVYQAFMASQAKRNNRIRGLLLISTLLSVSILFFAFNERSRATALVKETQSLKEELEQCRASK